jgi:hypothetical protein
MTEMEAYGLSVNVVESWNVEIFRIGDGSPADVGLGFLTEEELANSPPILHAATVELPAGRSTYGLEVVETLQPDDAFVALIDHGKPAAKEALFVTPFLPMPLEEDDLDPTESPRGFPGIVFTQRFFNTSGRGFCLFVAINEMEGRASPLGRVNSLLEAIVISELTS